MSFNADKQTLDDLNLLGKYKPSSVYNIFNKAQTEGGERLLEQMFERPLADATEINQRARIFEYFQRKQINFPLNREQMNRAETYLHLNRESGLFSTGLNLLRKWALKSVVHDEEYDNLVSGLQATISVLISFIAFLNQPFAEDADNPYREKIAELKHLLNHPKLKAVLLNEQTEQMPVSKVISYHRLFNDELSEVLTQVTQSIYFLDVCITVSNVARHRGFAYAQVLSDQESILTADDLRHPEINNAIGNPVRLSNSNNLIFLTGANMAGKSTFMKALGVNFYLAHMGFPVAARQMQFSVKEGIYSSINVPDNLNLGYSHFYAEVLRVKKVAEEVSSGKKLLVIFDELFKGTNVKDAHDATLEVTTAFSDYLSCFFVISTHIIEVGETLQNRCNHMQALYLPTVMKGNVPTYPYLLQPGISSDRHGMMIIENEGILELLSV